MRRKVKKNSYLLFVVCCLLFIHVTAQTSSVSPYSRYGIGELQNNGFARNYALGGSGIALQSDSVAPFFVNIMNPASYASLRLTTFEVGMLSNTTSLNDTGNNVVKNAVSLGYISFGIPFSKWWGGSFGLMPYSSVGYKISDQKNIDSIGNVDYLYQGSGGINKLYFGNAIKIKNFSMGVNASYLFGTINYSSRDILSDGISFNTRVNKSTTVNDIYFDYGLQYTIKIDSLRDKRTIKKDSLSSKILSRKKDIEDIKITFGLTSALQSDISAKSTTLIERYKLTPYGTEIVKDTIPSTPDSKGTITLPFSIGAGMAIKKGERWLVTGDYSVQNWSDFSLFGSNTNLKNSMKVSLGGQYVPAKQSDSQRNYWKKIHYRVGVKYYKTSLDLQNTPINEYSMSIGVGLPVGRVKILQQFSMMNISLELGQRGTTANSLVKEQFVKATLGVTINDRWFIKTKFD